jgi:hypothetical protein
LEKRDSKDGKNVACQKNQNQDEHDTLERGSKGRKKDKIKK